MSVQDLDEVVMRKEDTGMRAQDRGLLVEASIGNLEGVQYAVEHKGADVNAKDNDGWSILMEATYWDRLDVVKYLVEKGADVNARDDTGQSALKIAELSNHSEIVECLKLRGAKQK